MSDIKSKHYLDFVLSHLQEKVGNSYQKSIHTYQTTIGDWINYYFLITYYMNGEN